MNLGETRIQTLQKETKQTLRARKFPWRVDADHFVDGEMGPMTRRTAGFMAFCKGAPEPLVNHVHRGEWAKVSGRQFRILTGKIERPEFWVVEDKHRRPVLRRLRAEHEKAVALANDPNVHPIVTFDGNPCAHWIADELAKARKRGWQGVLVSGYRTPQHSQDLCFAMCGAASCPGRCAGTSSNHTCPPSFKCVEFEGAADCSDFTRLLSILRAMDSPLHGGALPADLVHFSHSGV